VELLKLRAEVFVTILLITIAPPGCQAFQLLRVGLLTWLRLIDPALAAQGLTLSLKASSSIVPSANRVSGLLMRASMFSMTPAAVALAIRGLRRRSPRSRSSNASS